MKTYRLFSFPFELLKVSKVGEGEGGQKDKNMQKKKIKR